MTADEQKRTESLTIVKAVLLNVYDGERVVGQVAGDSWIDEQGRWTLGLGLDEARGARDIDLLEGDEFEFVGGTWRVAKVYEPTTAPRGAVAELVRVTRPEA